MATLTALIRTARALWRLLRTLLHVGHGMAVVALQWRWLDEAGRHARIQWWAAKLLRCMGLRLQLDGQVHGGATLLVANHVSWLDILAIHAVCPQARFVSKADVRHWPLLGWLVASVGTLFIERERKRDALRVVHQVADSLRAGQTVALFPEGTTGDGQVLLPFHANLLQPAIVTGTPVQALGLNYSEPGHAVSPAVSWVGATSLLHSVWAIASASGVQVRITLLPAIATAHADRRALAAHLHQLVLQATRSP